jgi:hypothetical protein
MLTAAGATGAVLSSGLWMPGLALAQSDGAAPQPVPEGFAAFGKFFHLDPSSPGPTAENSAIFDFQGYIGVAAVGGTGTGIDTSTGQQHHLLFDVDMRFMQGVYIGVDRQQHTGTFGFIRLDLYKGQVAPQIKSTTSTRVSLPMVCFGQYASPMRASRSTWITQRLP